MLADFLFRNPWARAFIPLAFMAAASVAASVLVAEITAESEVMWGDIPKYVSFYILLLATIAAAAYQVAISKYDRAVYKGFTPKQYEASIRNQVAEAVARRSLRLIQNGEIDQLERETEAFKRMYGEGGQ